MLLQKIEFPYTRTKYRIWMQILHSTGEVELVAPLILFDKNLSEDEAWENVLERAIWRRDELLAPTEDKTFEEVYFQDATFYFQEDGYFWVSYDLIEAVGFDEDYKTAIKTWRFRNEALERALQKEISNEIKGEQYVPKK